MHAAVQFLVVSNEVGELQLRASLRPVIAHEILGVDGARARMSEVRSTGTETLASLTERQREERFESLQQRLPAVWSAMRMNLAGESIVVVPSVTLDRVVDRRAPVQAYEERLLFLFFSSFGSRGCR